MAQGQDTKTTAAARNWFQQHAVSRAELRSSVASSQTGATVIPGGYALINQAAANGSFVLKSIATQDAAPAVFVMNLSGQTVNIYPTTGEMLNGTANAALSVANGALGIFLAYGNYSGGALGTADWRAVALT